MEKLKHCPFCGSTIAPRVMLLSDANLTDEGTPEYEWDSTHFVAVCCANHGGCGANVICKDGGEDDAAAIWNRRANDRDDHGEPPIWKNGESVIHVSRADGTGGFEKNKWADWTCPKCGWFVGEQYIPRRHNQQKCNFCSRCGQKIDWSRATGPEV